MSTHCLQNKQISKHNKQYKCLFHSVEIQAKINLSKEHTCSCLLQFDIYTFLLLFFGSNSLQFEFEETEILLCPPFSL